MEGEERRELPLFPQKSKLCALSQPLDNAFGILLLVSSDVLRKEDNRENFKKMGHFLSLRQLLIVFQSPSLRNAITHLFPSLLTPKQSCTSGKIAQLVHNKTCLHMQRILQTPVYLFPRGFSHTEYWVGQEGLNKKESKSFPLTGSAQCLTGPLSSFPLPVAPPEPALARELLLP